MKILQINTEKTWRGGERQTFYTLMGLQELGVDTTLVARKNYPLAQKSKEINIKVVEVSEHLSVIPFLLFHGHKFDVIHVQTSMLLTYAVITKLFHKRPVLLSRRVDFVPKGVISFLKYKAADKVIGITDAIITILGNFGLKNTYKISECVEEKTLNNNRAQEFIKQLGINDKIIIGTTAALVPHKDPETMVKAIYELNKLRQDFVFLHFGDGELFNNTQALIKQLNLEKQYLLLGFQEQVEDFFSVMKVFTMSSEQEGLGSSVLDAFIYKVPVASTNAGGLKETIEGHGLLSEVKDHEALANNINLLLNDSKLSLSLAEKAYQISIDRHSIKKISQDHIDLYRSLIN